MADVFVSYARADRQFVRRLHDALQSAGRDSWVDWEDIPPSAEWLNEIFSGIEGADTFVFVVSPQSVASRVCVDELAHAARHHKRIIPLLWRQVPVERMPEVVQKLNWIDFSIDPEFTASCDCLLRAIDTDLPFVKQHTRLLVRALEWDRARRDKSLTLRGQDLRTATEWLDASAAGATPAATSLQTAYISASRDAESRRRLIMLAASGVAVVVASGLAVLAEWQRRVAVRERDTAISRELASVSIAQVEGDPELAILLASEAIRRSPTIEAEDALRHALSGSHLRGVLHGHESFVNSAAFSSDGRLLVTTSGDDTARVWDVASAAQLLKVAHGSSVDSAWFSPRGTFLATIGDNERSRVWRAATGDLVLDLDGKVGPGAFSSDETLLVTSGEDGGAAIWELATRKELRSLPSDVSFAQFNDDSTLLLTLEGGRARLSNPRTGRTRSDLKGDYVSAAMTPDGETIVLAGDATTKVWGAESKEVVILPSTSDAVAISPDGRLVATAHEDEEDEIVRLWTAEGKATAQVRGHFGRSGGRAFSRDGTLLVTARDNNTAVVWNATSGDPVAVLRGHRETVTSASFDSFGNYVATSSEDGDARVWALSGVRLIAPLPHGSTVRAIAFSASGDVMVTGGDTGGLELWRPRTGERIVTLDGDQSMIVSTAFSADGGRVIAAGQAGGARVWDVATRAPVATFAAESVDFVALSAEGTIAFTAGGEGGVIWNTRSGRRIATLAPLESRIVAARFEESGRALLTAATNGSVSLWDVDSGRMSAELHTAGQRLPPIGTSRLAKPLFAVSGFSPRGSGDQQIANKVLFGLGDGPLVRIWDAALGRTTRVLRGHVSDVTYVAFDPRGRFVATASDDYTARVWDALTGRAVAVLRGHDDFVNVVAFGPDGMTIATGSFDGRAHLYLCEVCGDADHLLKLARARVTRTLTEAERQEYLEH